MCGRVVVVQSPDEIAEQLDADNRIVDAIGPDYNMGPTRTLPAVTADVDGQRSLRLMRWGLIPGWANDPSIGSRMFNARLETIEDKPAFRSAFVSRRCIVAVTGYYEWEQTVSASRPWYLYSPAGDMLPLAGLYELWTDAEGRRMETCTIITTSSTDADGKLHERSPLLVPDKVAEGWLDPTVETGRLFTDELIAATPGDNVRAHRVSPAVGSVRNNGPELIDPYDDEQPSLF